MSKVPQTDAEYRASTLYAKRHSVAHLLAHAVLEKFPDAKLGVGPPTRDGFYYDFALPRPLTPEDLAGLQERVRALIRDGVRFERHELTTDEAVTRFADQPLKLELIRDIVAGGVDDNGEPIEGPVELSVYESGDFEDLCRGPHIEDSSAIHPDAVALLRVSGAYWRGDEKRQQLQRIYGTVMDSPKELRHYLWQLEEAKKRDHRVIGEALDLFAFSPAVGKGLPLWLPNGTIVRDELETWAREVERAHGYQRIVTPHITKSDLYYISGHLPYYADDLYSPIDIDGEEYYLKPMNCPHHHMVYKARPRSYRELPLRLAEYGTVYRYERSGQLFGMMRVRGFSQNDAHIYCTREQAIDEFLAVMRLHALYYDKLGIEDYHMVLALRDPKNTEKYHGDELMWQEAERITRDAMEQSGIPYIEDIGGAAHYGPKVDFVLTSVTGREFAASTNQVDLYMPEQFGLTFTNRHGEAEQAVVLHRAPLGSHERFVAFLIEHFAGAFPVWLAPVQVRVVPISDRQADGAAAVWRRLVDAGIRAELDDSDNTMQAKIRRAEQQKVPYVAVIGDRELENDSVSVRARGRRNLGSRPVPELIEKLGRLIADRAMTLDLDPAG
ncbi:MULTISPECIES: threonine--tRNA ligase [Protofrankia]|uniref:Threonine--tRNA ligase n=1 Tax=Candidatus Protofrankia datiscae TaxID=2716812 RepID=F8B0G7_9ACTN|nr:MULTISPECIES: threonine--tRNA ligase [Protofrankia]AEH09716.1 threonyl-tRNA synthetase [Candidatus Protofrankia datiscae]